MRGNDCGKMECARLERPPDRTDVSPVNQNHVRNVIRLDVESFNN